MSAFKFKEIDSKTLKKVGLNYETELNVYAIISVQDVSIRDSIKYHYDMSTKKLTLLGYHPTGHKIKIGYVPEEVES